MDNNPNDHKDLSPDYNEPFTLVSYIIIQSAITTLYAFMFGFTYWYKDEPRVRARSPLLLLVIFIGSMADTLCKTHLLIRSPKDLGLRCQTAIYTRIVNHYLIFAFLIIRIKRVHAVD